MNWPVLFSILAGFFVGVIFTCHMFRTKKWRYDE